MILTPGNQIIHSGRLMGYFRDKDPYQPIKEPPFFYTTLDQASADNIEKLSCEIQLIKYKLISMKPSLNLDYVKPIGERILSQYGDMVKDPSSLKNIFTSNAGYKVMKIPMVKKEHGYLLNLNARVFVEDIPYGLVVLKDIAEKVDLKTPHIDKAIQWHQKLMNKDFLVGDRLNQNLIEQTGAPTRYGFKTI